MIRTTASLGLCSSTVDLWSPFSFCRGQTGTEGGDMLRIISLASFRYLKVAPISTSPPTCNIGFDLTLGVGVGRQFQRLPFELLL